MLKNYLKIAVRKLAQNKVYSIINVSGLAVGMACAILVASFIREELSYDKFHRNAERIYRVTASTRAEKIPGWIGTPALLGPALQQKFPEIESYTRIDPFSFKHKTLISHGDVSFYEQGFVLADPGLFRMFDFKLLAGDPEQALARKNSLLITESMARKYFGSDNPIGKTLNYEGQHEFIVSGVLADVSSNSHLQFNFVAPFEYLDEIHQRDISRHWGMQNYYTYVLLKENADVQELQDKIAALFAEHRDSPTAVAYLQPFTEIHLHSKIARDPHRQGDITGIYLYAAIVVVILLIACVNFMNLYTASSEIRAKEIGIRKVLGSFKRQLVLQFLSEAFFLALIALPVALLLVELALPLFNQITGKTLAVDYLNDTGLFAGILLLTMVIGAVAGSYPAFFLSSFQPVKMLSRKFNGGEKGLKFRNILVVFQFAVTVVIIAGTLVINNQMRFVQEKKLGYDRENIVNVPIYSPEAREKYPTYRNEILSHAKIIDVTATSFTPSVERWREGLYFEGRLESDEHSFYRMSGDYNLLEVFDIQLIAGRGFDRNIPADLYDAYILNESAVREIGWQPQEAIGKRFGNRDGVVIGVVTDFHFRSLRREMQPLAINVLPRMFQFISIKTRPGDLSDTIAFLERKWAATNPGIPFEYTFYDDEFEKLYRADLKLKTLFGSFSFLSIFIACLGLFGLSLFVAQRRTKEIGVRKVLGASAPEIVRLLLSGIVKLVLIASIFAWPVAYFAMHSWLAEFAYRTTIHWSIFLFAGGLALLIALLTVSTQAIRAALANPVEALRYE